MRPFLDEFNIITTLKSSPQGIPHLFFVLYSLCFKIEV